MENIKLNNIVYILVTLILLSVLLCGCEGRYLVEMTQEEVDNYTALTRNFLTEKFEENDFVLDSCMIPMYYANRKEAEKDKDNWKVRCYGKGEDATVYNVYFNYNTKEIISYVADHPDGTRDSSMDD